MHILHRRKKQMENQVSRPTTVVTSCVAAWLFLTCASAAWSQAGTSTPPLSSEQVVQHLIEKNQERAAVL
jgi:hypothetical protein